MKQVVVLVGGTLLLAGVGFALSARRRPSNGAKPGIVEGSLGQVEPVYEVGDICVFEEGYLSAIDSNGECVEFWNPAAAETMRNALVQEFEQQGSPAAACVPVPVYDHGTGGTRYTQSAAARDLVRTVLRELYPGVTWPPPQNAQPWQTYIFDLAGSIFEDEVCNFPAVT